MGNYKSKEVNNNVALAQAQVTTVQQNILFLFEVMGSTKCCRMCLNSEDLHPIFYYPEHYVKYTNIIYDTAGIKVEINDTLSHEICLHCIRFINRSIKFRRKCEQVQEILENKCNIKVLSELKIDPDLTNIDIADTLSNSDDDFKDYDDNITLDTFQINNIPTENDKASHIEKEEIKEQFIDESIAFDKKERSSVRKRVSRKIKSTDGKEKRNGDRGEVESLWQKVHNTSFIIDALPSEARCDQCPARFKSVTLMRIHKNRHRAPQYRYKCGICDNSFARRRNAARHLQRVHAMSPDHHIHRQNIN
ncbi:unnamed protein product [Leptidea sinapis]|uniref:Uncharacterized protein n=1 Tax=Leptidea sinapis TaxID=189913 RepID=A0A5E4R156_9NEOP|nr:unnamed protein product [Leptidea sinapis]